jgi:RHS repeat-associated protein
MSKKFALLLGKVLLITILVSLSGIAVAQISFVQVNSGPSTFQSFNSSVAVTYTSAQTAGNLNIVAVGWGDTTSSVSLVSDSRGNTYSPAGATTTGTGLRQAIYYAKNIAAGSNTVTVTFNQAAAGPDVRILEYSGLDTSTPLDATAAAVGNGTTANSGYATTTSATELIFGAGTSGYIFSAAGTGFTKRIINIYGNIAEDKVVTGVGSYNATATNNTSNWVMQVVTFRAIRITRIRVHEVTSPVVGYRYATSTVGQGLTTSVVNSVSGPTSGVQLTKTAGGTPLVWISPPLAAAVTISGTVTMSAWGKESVAACNCGMQVTLHKYSGGTVGSAFLNSERGTELGNGISQQSWTASPTITSFSVGDRIVIKWWINDAGGTMSSGRTVTTDYDGANEGADGDTWVQFTEILSFQPEPEIIQNKSEALTGASSIDVTLNPVSAGHMVAVVITADPPSTMVTSVTDNSSGGSCNYIEANALNVNTVTGGGLSDIWYCPNSKAGAFYFPATVSPATSGKLSIWAYEVSGLDTISPLDVSGIASDPGSHSTYTGVSLTTSAATDFLVEANEGSCGSPSSISAPWTLDASPGNDASAYLTATGNYQPTFTFTCAGSAVMSGAAFRPASPNQAPLVDAGPSQIITLPTNSAALNGSATDDGLPNGTLSITWTKVSGPGTVTFTNSNAENTQATFSTTGTYVLQLAASDSQLNGSSTVTVIVNPEPISLVLSPVVAGPDVRGTTQALTAVLKIANTGTPITGVSVHFTVTGPNATSGNATTDAAGTATFNYTGANSGTDTVQASYTGQNSNSANVSWLVPTQPISTSTVNAQFFVGDGGCHFDITPGTRPAFTMTVPNINFNPPSNLIPGNTTIGTNTRPFTDVTTDQNGNFTGTLPAQGNGLQAGVGSMLTFQGVFTGSFTVAAAGNVSFNIYTDDGFLLGIGGGATLVSGPLTNIPPSGLAPFSNLPIVSGYNTNTNPLSATIVVNFPAAGTFPYELDYNECFGGSTLSLNLSVGQSGSTTGLAPSSSLALTPINPASLPTGQNQGFTVLATDASGAPVPNATVALSTYGANQKFLTATTDGTGHATFQYSGVNAGIDTVQASTNITGTSSYSNVASMTWTVPTGGGSTVFAPQGWIGSPVSGSVVQSQVPITVASGITLSSGTLTYWPTSNPAAITTLNSNTTGTGTIGTFDATGLASGGYTIQLNATASGTTQVSQIAVSITGDNKPGRMTSTVTEFKVPLAGIPISITRTYDSLDRSKVEDFGFGWKLGTFVDLQVDAQKNVTFNFGGRRVTFFFTPQPISFFGVWLVPAYTPQAGVHGSLASDGCGGLLRLQSGLVCFPFTDQTYQPTVYAYTDPVGRTYTVSASGQLQSIKDLNGNVLTVSANGITSSVNGVVIPFVRDGQNRITKITDLNGKDYIYSYDPSTGNLQSVTYPALTHPETYTYFADHSLQSETDPRQNTSSAVYYSSSNDGGQSQLDGRLFSITDTMGNTWNYSYNLTTNTTTTTNPLDGQGNRGTVVRTDDSFGKPLSITEQVDATTNRTTTHQYDANENLVSMTDPLHSPATIYTYDANGFQTSVQDPLGHTSHKTYNQFGGVTSATDAANTNTVTTTYDANFNPIQMTDLLNGPGTQVSTNTYDSLGNLLVFVDGNSKPTEYAYDPNGNLAQVTDALNEMTHYHYDAMGRLASLTDPLNHLPTTFEYDALGRLKTRTDALQNKTTYFYDDNGNKTSETDGNNHTTLYQYDNMNRVNLITYPTVPATTRQFTYDFRGNKLTETDQSGRVTKYVYDLAGQLSTVTYAFGTADAGTMTYTYDLDGRTKTVKDELNNLTTNNYDAAGRLTSVQDATANPPTNYGYDFDNRKTSVQDPNGNTISYAYFPRNWLKTITYPAAPPNPSTTTQYTYDGMGRVKTTTDQAGKVTIKAYDDVGRLSSVTDALLPTGNITHYTYDLAGNLKTIQDANNHTTSFQYDSLNRRMTRSLPLGQMDITTYDGVSNLSAKTDFNGKTTIYNYDQVNRLTQKIPDASLSQPTISFTYTPTGKRASMTDASGTTNYTVYDSRDRLKTKVTPEGTLNYTYDAHGNVLTIASSNTNGASMTYTYDVLNRLASATDNRVAAQGGPSAPTTYSYDPARNLTGYGYSNTVKTSNVFDALNRLTQTCVATTTPACTAGQKLASYAYTLGPAGNRTNVLELNGRSVAYGYDNDYRLTSEAITADPSGNNGTVSYNGFDNVGNRTSMTSTLNAVPGGTFSYDANDKLSIDTFDANGNTTSSAGITNTYDFENRMLAHGAVTLVYDGNGNRVSETVGGSTTKFLVDSLNPTKLPQVMDELVNGSVNRTYAYGRQRISENQLLSGTWTPSFYGYDGHGNVRFLTNASGTITDSYDFDAFGMPIRTSGTTPNSFLYSGERNDGSIGLYDLRARYYNQATGRFWARDLVEGRKCCGLSWNPYVFVMNNPVNMKDPLGRQAIIEYNLTLVCGGSLYCGPAITVAGLKIAVAWTLIAAQLAELLEYATHPDTAPPPEHNPDDEPSGDRGSGPESPPISGPPTAGEK